MSGVPVLPENQGPNRHIFLRGRRKKKKVPTYFYILLSFPIFKLPSYNFNFPSFLLNFHPFSIFSLSLFSRYVSKNFPVRSLGGTLPAACYATADVLKKVLVLYGTGTQKWSNIVQYLCTSTWDLKDLMPITFSSPRAKPEVVYFLVSNESSYFSNCKSKFSASDSL